MTTLFLTLHIEGDAGVCCEDCGWVGIMDQVDAISDAEERLMPGCETPAGECPDCGSLAYLTQGN